MSTKAEVYNELEKFSKLAIEKYSEIFDDLLRSYWADAKVLALENYSLVPKIKTVKINETFDDLIISHDFKKIVVLTEFLSYFCFIVTKNSRKSFRYVYLPKPMFMDDSEVISFARTDLNYEQEMTELGLYLGSDQKVTVENFVHYCKLVLEPNLFAYKFIIVNTNITANEINNYAILISQEESKIITAQIDFHVEPEASN